MTLQRLVKTVLRGKGWRRHDVSDLEWLRYHAFRYLEGKFRKSGLGTIIGRHIPVRVAAGGYHFAVYGIDPCSTFEISVDRYGCYEPAIVKRLPELIDPGDICYDVGAGVGYYSLLFSYWTNAPSNVVAVEANRRQWKFFWRNFRSWEAKPRLIGKYLVAGQRPGCISFRSLFENSAALVPNVVKMDIEGAEYEVLMGAADILDRARPKLCVEVHPLKMSHYSDSAPEELFGMLGRFYNIEYVRNHWGYSKGPEDFAWRNGTPSELVDMSRRIIVEHERPRGFAIICTAKERG